MRIRYASLKHLILVGIIFFFLFGSNIQPAFADITMKVKVTDCSSGQPIAGAALSVTTGRQSNPQAAYTNDQGITTLTPVRPGYVVHTFVVRAEGYVKYTWSEYLDPGATYRELCMTPYSYSSQETEEPILETEEPVSELCGLSQVAYVKSGMTSYPQNIIVPCCSSEAIAYGFLGSFGDGNYHRYINPVFEMVTPFDTTLGYVNRKLQSFDSQEQIPGCQACGLCDAQPTLYDAIFLADLTWSGGVKALQPVDFILHLRGQGRTIQDQEFIIKLDFGQDFPYNHLQFFFDSQDSSSASQLQPSKLQEGDFTMRVSGIRLPMTYIGSIYASIYLKKTPASVSSVIRELKVASSQEASYHCAGAALTAVSTIGTTLLPQSQITLLQLEYQHKVELCGDNAGCQAGVMAEFQESWFEKVLGMVSKGPEKIALVMKSLVEFGFDFTKCATWLVDFFKELMHQANQSSEPVTGFLTASPVYPLVREKTSGRQTGFLPDGRLVQEISDSYAIQLGEQRLVLLPGAGKEIELSVFAYESGSMSLYAAQAQEGGGDKLVTYKNVRVDKGARISLDPGNPAFPLEIKANGLTASRAPDSILLTSPGGDSRELPIPALTPTPASAPESSFLADLSPDQICLGTMLCLSLLAIVLLAAGFILIAIGYRKPKPN